MATYIGDDDDEMAGDEILGDDDMDILGDDLDEILGADRRSRSRGLALARKVALARAAGGAYVRNRQPNAAQEQVLPFPLTSVAAAGQATILAFPQRKFRTERFAVSSQIAEFFTIGDLRIGRESMMVAVGVVPAQIFAEVGVGVRLRGYTANLGNTIGVDVVNLDAVNAHTFLAAIVGTAVF